MNRLFALLLLLAGGCAMLPNGMTGWSAASINVPCNGGSINYSAPFGVVIGSVVASCEPSADGGMDVSISTNFGPNVAAIIAALISQGILAVPPQAPPSPKNPSIYEENQWL